MAPGQVLELPTVCKWYLDVQLAPDKYQSYMRSMMRSIQPKQKEANPKIAEQWWMKKIRLKE